MGLGPKYVIFNEEAFGLWFSQVVEMAREGNLNLVNPPPTLDGVVLRPQDVFAAPALMEYAGQIRTAVEIVEALFPEGNRPLGLDTKLAELKDLANGFAEEGFDAYDHPSRKIPD